MTSSYYRGAHGILIVFDITARRSFENINSYLKEIEKNTTDYKTVEKILIGNKIDKMDERQVTKEEAETFAKSNGLLYLETTAEDSSISRVFQILVDRVLLNPQLVQNNTPNLSSTLVELEEEKSYFEDNCCLFHI